MNAAFDMEIKKCFKKLGPKQYRCMKCNYRATERNSMMRHVECNHFVTRGFPCGTYPALEYIFSEDTKKLPNSSLSEEKNPEGFGILRYRWRRFRVVKHNMAL
ncbi:Broad-complex core protein isoform 6 [Caligus rogercresseyi]|uniref:Broad-complex core protein isoform 6 n=1 Tax=Caligus rogercresseyi TaxID=217165 RepID=A0A7T8GTS0_CALRO|nr:Broad-complex core protein isoform 6 [Caligus rogercresseyi]